MRIHIYHTLIIISIIILIIVIIIMISHIKRIIPPEVSVEVKTQ